MAAGESSVAKITVFDPYTPKFTQDMVDWWRAHGHEVQVDRYYDPEKVLWADVVWFDTCDNNIKGGTNPHEALIDDWLKEEKGKMGIPWDMKEMDLSKKKIVCRPIDIEVWQGHHAAVNWKLVNECIFIAPHIREIMMADSRPQESDMQVHTVPCAVNLDRYRFKERRPGNQVAIVSEKWGSKGTDLILQIALKLKRMGTDHEFHWLGKWSDYHWEREYFEEFVKHHELPFTFYEWVDSVDEFLEDKNYLLHASKKEAFSYATAEAMAKGIKPVLHRFFGADALWPGMTWDTIDDAIEMLVSDEYDSLAYRQYLVDHGYTIPQMMEKIDRIIFDA